VLGVEADENEANVAFRHYGMNQRGEIVCRATRTVRVRTRAAQGRRRERWWEGLTPGDRAVGA
jgi:hypothetical protein